MRKVTFDTTLVSQLRKFVLKRDLNLETCYDDKTRRMAS